MKEALAQAFEDRHYVEKQAIKWQLIGDFSYKKVTK